MRSVVASILLLVGTPAFAQEAAPFSRQTVIAEAMALAGKPFKAVADAVPKGVENLDYDQYRQIRFQREKSLWRGEALNFEVQLLPVGWLYKAPVEIEIVDGTVSRPLAPDNGFFDLGALGSRLSADARIGFSGFRINGPLNRPDVFDEIIVFQGASYFRALSRGQTFGLSARGLAINVGNGSGEEFPFFRKFWIEKPKPGANRVIIHALLDSPSTSGAYTITVIPGKPTATNVEMTLYPRRDITNIGIAPLTSMFLFGSINRSRISDFRAAVHDSDGLAMLNGWGENIWRPLNNPRRLQSSHFTDQNPKGFGLIQRARHYRSYQDLEAGYESRPSAWVQPQGEWGMGGVELFEIPSEEEIHDNIVTFWKPAQPLTAGRPHTYTYSLTWPDDAPRAWGGAPVTATRSGLANGPQRQNGVIQFAVDFGPLPGIGPGELPTAKLEANAGAVGSPVVQLNRENSGLRVSFVFDPKGVKSSEMRLQLSIGGKPVSETWLYRWTSD